MSALRQLAYQASCNQQVWLNINRCSVSSHLTYKYKQTTAHISLHSYHRKNLPIFVSTKRLDRFCSLKLNFAEMILQQPPSYWLSTTTALATFYHTIRLPRSAFWAIHKFWLLYVVPRRTAKRVDLKSIIPLRNCRGFVDFSSSELRWRNPRRNSWQSHPCIISRRLA